LGVEDEISLIPALPDPKNLFGFIPAADDVRVLSRAA